MKKPLRTMYHRQLLRPIIHMAFTRAILGLTAALLWDELVNVEVMLPMRAAAFLFLGAFFLAMGWMAYLRLDGVKAPVLDRRFFEWKRKPRHTRGDLSDFVDEEVVSYDDLEVEERDFCRLAADVLCGLLFLILSAL